MQQSLSTHPSSTETRQRLVEAASKVFAAQGFRRATIREICQQAKANVAAINYHFGGKEGLYAAVLRYAYHNAIEQYPPDWGLKDNATPEQRLHAFIRSFLLRILEKGRSACHGKLMAQEMINPTHALDTLVAEEIRPLAKQLEAMVQALLGSPSSPEQVRLCALSIAGQCLFYHHAQPVIARLYPEQQYSTSEIERLAEHITQFSLGALKQLAQTLGGGSK
jgi:AcrR family transcriptional regulator